MIYIILVSTFDRMSLLADRFPAVSLFWFVCFCCHRAHFNVLHTLIMWLIFFWCSVIATKFIFSVEVKYLKCRRPCYIYPVLLSSRYSFSKVNAVLTFLSHGKKPSAKIVWYRIFYQNTYITYEISVTNEMWLWIYSALLGDYFINKEELYLE